MEITGTSGLVVAGNQRLDESLRALGVLGDGRPGLVFDAGGTDPASWDEVAALLDDVFRLTQQAVAVGAPIVYVVDEPAIWGHGSPLQSALATALLGGMRSAAVELQRKQIPANAVALAGADEVPRAARAIALLLESGLTGQVLTCSSAHLTRPAA